MGTSLIINPLVVGGGGGAASSWFGDGSDGDAVINGVQNLPVAQDTGHVFKQYQSLTVNPGAMLTPANRCAGMVILVRGDCTIAGTISMDKKMPLRSEATENIIRNEGASARWLQKIAAVTGGAGGNGGANNAGNRAIAGNGEWCGGGYGAGGQGANKNGNAAQSFKKGGSTNPRPPVGISWPYPSSISTNAEYGAGGSGEVANSLGGNAPGGSGGAYWASSGGSTQIYLGENGDAYGGGLILLVVGGALTISGLITANGGNGGNGKGNSSAASGGGGGGGGGIIALLSRNQITLNGNLTANGGNGGTSEYGGNYVGLSGSVGTIYNAHLDNDGNVTPWA
ncbi:MAG: hypothetical protein LBD02_10765 [Christensenellaceae bacterium]|jgi:hypothetical protein|nr:hypothetical protein [Christensenellaceae bacterium]